MGGLPSTTAVARPRSCPQCGAPASHALRAVSSHERSEDLDFPKLRDHFIGFFREKTFFSYHRCADCSLLYAPTYFNEEQLGSLYADMPDNTAQVNRDVIVRTQRAYFRTLEKSHSLRGDYLEIGPDIGLFTHEAAAHGKFRKFWLYEPNRRVHAELAASVGPKAFEIRTEFLDLSAIPDGSIGAAVMIHVLDHILDPLKFLRELQPKLRPDGVVLAVTHDERSLLARALGARWPAYCLQHPHLYNPHSIRDLFTRAGFGEARVEKCANYFPVTYLASHLCYAIGLGRPRLPKWDALQLPLKLGNILTLASRKDSHA